MSKKIFLIVLVLIFSFGCNNSKKAGIEGKVIDGKEKPISGIKIVAKQEQPIKGYEQFEINTRNDGTFILKGLFPSSNYLIYPIIENGKSNVKIQAKSGPEGQIAILKEPLIIRFIINKNGIILDSRTGLQWTPASGNQMNWNQAGQYVQNLRLGGFSDWRLPKVKELEELGGLEDDTEITTLFKVPDSWPFAWSSELDNEFPNIARTFDFRYASKSTASKSYDISVLGVRSAK